MLYIVDHKDLGNIPESFTKLTFDQSSEDLDLYDSVILYAKYRHVINKKESKDRMIMRDSDEMIFDSVEKSIQTLILIVTANANNNDNVTFTIVEPDDSVPLIKEVYNEIISWLTNELGTDIPKFISIDNKEFDLDKMDVIAEKSRELLKYQKDMK